ncbi:MAG: hypothetical protein AB7E55_04535, partial [Pigmentiphaga sp.]
AHSGARAASARGAAGWLGRLGHGDGHLKFVSLRAFNQTSHNSFADVPQDEESSSGIAAAWANEA